jgi:hypothetical protein
MSNPVKEFEHALLVNRVASRYCQAMEFPTEEALKKYLKEHPDADKSKHTVKKTKEKESKGKDSYVEIGNIKAHWGDFEWGHNPNMEIWEGIDKLVKDSFGNKWSHDTLPPAVSKALVKAGDLTDAIKQFGKSGIRKDNPEYEPKAKKLVKKMNKAIENLKDEISKARGKS